MIGHATFCVVVVYNNVVAQTAPLVGARCSRRRRISAPTAGRRSACSLAVLSTALVAGGLLAFALSFDEVIVTTFTAGAQETLPIFILDNIQRGSSCRSSTS